MSRRSIPKYYEKMSVLLDELIAQRRQEAINYQQYLNKIVELTKKLKNPTSGDRIQRALTLLPSAPYSITSTKTKCWRWQLIKQFAITLKPDGDRIFSK